MKKYYYFLFILFFTYQFQAQISVVQDFDSSTNVPIGWVETGGLLMSTVDSCEGNSARSNLHSGNQTGSFTSPNQIGLSNGTDLSFSFNYKIENYNSTSAANPGWGNIVLEYSLNDGNTWLPFYTIDDSNHVVSNQCATISQIIPGTSLPNGSDFKFRFSYTWTGGYWDLYLDNIAVNQVTQNSPSCTQLNLPFNNQNNVTNTSLVWSVPTGVPTGYKLNIGTSSGGTDVLNMHNVGNVTSYDFQSAIPGTTYYVTVVPYNGNGIASGCTESIFSTCGVVTAPFSEGFENGGSIPSCWTMNGGEPWLFSNSGTGTFVGNNGNIDGYTMSSGYFAWVDDTGTPTNDVTLTSPLIDVSALSVPQLVFFEISNSPNSLATLNVEVWDGAIWNTVGSYTTTTPNGWTKRVIDLSNLTIGGNIRVRFTVLGSSSSYDDIAIDDVIVQETPTCIEPINFIGTNITDTTIDLSWSDPTGGQFDFEYIVQAGGSGFPLSSFSGVPVYDSESVTVGLSSPLIQDTTYEVWVRALCGSSKSDWVGPIQFTTLCSVKLAPYLYGVEDAISTTESLIEKCWASIPFNSSVGYRWNVNSISTTPTTLTGPSEPYEGLRYFYVESSNGSAGAVAELYTPVVDMSGLTSRSLQFYYHMFGSSMGELHVDIFNGNSWVNDVDIIVGQQQVSNADLWKLKIIDLTTFTGTIQARFRAVKGSGGNGDISIDNINFDEMPTCFNVTNVLVTDVTNNTVEISWNDVNGTSSWNVEYGVSGFTPGTGTLVSATTNPYVLGSLNPLQANISYDFYIQSNCGIGDLSTFLGPFSFTTYCEVSAPWVYNVETATTTTNSSIGDCWVSSPKGTTSLFRWNVGTSTPTSSTGPSGANSGAQFFYAESSSGSQGSLAELYTPFVSINTLSTPSLQYYYHMYGVTTGELHVDIFDGTSWVNDIDVLIGAQQTLSTDVWKLRVVSLAGYTGTVRVRFRVIKGNGTTGDISLDDISFVEAPTCIDPIGFAVSDVSSNSATLSWTDMSTSGQFNFEYVIQSQGTGIPTVSGISVNNVNTVVDATLVSETFYEAWLRADCGNGEFSSWVGPVVFSTTCSVLSVPASENFDSYLPSCWEEADNGNLVSGPSIMGASSWTSDGFSNNGTTGAIRCILYGLGVNDWIMSPYYHIPSIGYELKFIAALTQWGQNFAPTVAWDNGDRVEVLVSTGTTNWTVLYTYDNTNTPLATGSTNAINLNAYAGLSVRFAFRVVSGPTDGLDDTEFFIDNFEINLASVTAPACVTNLVASPDESCGNFGTVINWDTVADADGYKINLGTTPGGNDVLNMVDIGYVNSYSYVAGLNEQFYCTVIAYNQIGIATGCSEVSFVTNANGCYCASLPTSLNNNGVSNVTIGTSDYPNGVVTYADFSTTNTPQNLQRGELSNVQVTFETGVTYWTNVWIDFNDDFYFDSSELVSSGVSLSNDPSILNMSFAMPSNANLGNHRMRIGTADSGQYNPNPCYSGTFGVTLDFTVNVIENLNSSTFVNDSFKVYPNPVENTLNLEYNTEITNIKVFNLPGQVVINENINAISAKLDMSQLNIGTYMVHVMIDNSVKTVKVIKK
jgi:hypothetical protein